MPPEPEGEALTPFAEGLWTSSAPVRFLGMRLSATMTVFRLADGSLLLHSPVAMTSARRAAVEALGPVGHLYSPNLYHHLRIGEWAAAFPSARLHAPWGLAKKRPDLRIDRTHGDLPEPAFAGIVDELRIDGFRLQRACSSTGRRARWWSPTWFTTSAAPSMSGRRLTPGPWASTTASP